MRSSPNFLVVSRSERDPEREEDRADPRAGWPNVLAPDTAHRWPRRDDLEFNELNVSLKISYKTLVLAFVLFDVFHKVVNVVFDLNLF